MISALLREIVMRVIIASVFRGEKSPSQQENKTTQCDFHRLSGHGIFLFPNKREILDILL